MYCLCGMGTDYRIYSFLNLKDVEIRYLEWFKPEPEETTWAYAQRLADEIDTSEDFGIIGMSFGGMMATEVSKIVKPKFLVLISSIMTYEELPMIYRMAGGLGLHKLVQPLFVKSIQHVGNLFINEGAEKKEIVEEMTWECDPDFLQWAIGKGAKWKNSVEIDAIRIHGTSDIVLPMPRGKVDLKITGGTHLIVMTHGYEISQYLNSYIRDNFS